MRRPEQKVILKHGPGALQSAAHRRLAQQQPGCCAVMLFSSAIAANVIRRFKSTCRSFSRRMAVMTIMHEPHVLVWSSVTM